MQISNLPAKFPVPFASGAGASYTRAVPQASQQGITAGAASLTDGFPPLCFIPTTANGIPPAGQDINGILNQITAWNRWQNAGGTVPYDGAFSSAIGGYPYGAIVQSTASSKLWMSIADNNTSNPDAGGAGWIGFGGPQAAARVSTTTGSSVVTIHGSTNVSSVTLGTTAYGGATMNTLIVSFITPLSNANYVPLITAGTDVNPGGNGGSEAHPLNGSITQNGFTILMMGNTSGVYPDLQTNLGFAVIPN